MIALKKELWKKKKGGIGKERREGGKKTCYHA